MGVVCKGKGRGKSNSAQDPDLYRRLNRSNASIATTTSSHNSEDSWSKSASLSKDIAKDIASRCAERKISVSNRSPSKHAAATTAATVTHGDRYSASTSTT